MQTKRTLIAAALCWACRPWRWRARHLPRPRGPNGGQMQDIGSYHGELLAQDGRAHLLPLRPRRPPARRRAGATGNGHRAGRRAGSRPSTFAPRPDGTALVASGEFRADPGLRVVVQLVPAAGQPARPGALSRPSQRAAMSDTAERRLLDPEAHLLVVEDDGEMRNLVARLLREAASASRPRATAARCGRCWTARPARPTSSCST